MDNQKLITVVLWSALAFVAYEVFRSFYPTTTAAQLGGGTLAQVQTGVSDILSTPGELASLASVSPGAVGLSDPASIQMAEDWKF